MCKTMEGRVGALPEVSVGESGSLMPSIKMTTPGRSSSSETAWGQWKGSQFFWWLGDQELALYPLHPPNCTAVWPAGGKCTVQRQALLAWEESCRSWELSGKHWQLVLFRFGNQLMHGLFSCAVRVAGLCMLFCGGVISVCFSYIGLLCYCLRFACSFITFLVLGSRL